MSFLILNIYFSLNLLLSLLAFAPQSRSPGHQLKIQHFILSFFALFCLSIALAPSVFTYSPLIEVIKGTENAKLTLIMKAPIFSPSVTSYSNSIDKNLSDLFVYLLIAGLLAIAAFKIGRELLTLSRLLKNTLKLRKIFGIRIHYSETNTSPFSLYIFKTLHIVIPAYILENPRVYRLVIKHEIQHHRQRDTLWTYPIYIFKVLCFWNPLALKYLNKLDDFQEFACDEVLIKKKRIPPQAYAEHLLWVAQHAKMLEQSLCALRFASSHSQLKRRIEKMIKPKTTKNWSTPFAVLSALCCFLAAAWSSKAIIQDRQITYKQATALVENSSESEFQTPINKEVLKALNYFVGTEAGRKKMRESLERMGNYENLIQEKLDEYSMPSELMAIPIIESGYQNLPESNIKGWGAGLWMFIKSTARNFGLRVDNTVDQRMNEKLLTDAAMRLLQANKLRFKDWHLSLLAYYVGEGKVQKFIEKTSSRDPWKLVEAGIEEKRGYLANVIASAIIIKNPHLVQ